MMLRYPDNFSNQGDDKVKAKFLIFASVFLCSCSQDGNQNVKQGDFQADPPRLITMNDYSLPMDTSDSREMACDREYPESARSGVGGQNSVTPMDDSDSYEVASM